MSLEAWSDRAYPLIRGRDSPWLVSVPRLGRPILSPVSHPTRDRTVLTPRIVGLGKLAASPAWCPLVLFRSHDPIMNERYVLVNERYGIPNERYGG